MSKEDDIITNLQRAKDALDIEFDPSTNYQSMVQEVLWYLHNAEALVAHRCQRCGVQNLEVMLVNPSDDTGRLCRECYLKACIDYYRASFGELSQKCEVRIAECERELKIIEDNKWK